MRLFFKILSMLCFVFCVVIFSLTVFGSLILPDIIVAENGSFNSKSAFFKVSSAASDGQALSVNALESGETKAGQAEYELLGIFPVKNVRITQSDRQYVFLSGEPIGLKIYSDGVIVVGTDDVPTQDGTVNPAKQAGLIAGDIITAIDGVPVGSGTEFARMISHSENETVRLTVERNGEKTETELKLVRSDGGALRAGLWIRDSFAGIGTMTFYTSDLYVFGGLGHAVSDIDTGKAVPVRNGEAVGVTVDGCIKGTSSTPGELYGTFSENRLGFLKVNSDTGVYGLLSSTPRDSKSVPVATEKEVKTGAAQILTTVDSSGAQYYDIRIVKLFPSQKGDKRNIVIEITDEDLISKTGGIVQGMSGSPIIQDGKLVGAVTHVFLNDPLQGYGIYAEDMLKSAQKTENELKMTESAA